MKSFLSLCCLAAGLFGQGEAIEPDLHGMAYPALARSARVQGTVRFVVKDGAAELVSGHPMLIAAAKANLDRWAVGKNRPTEFVVDYVFSLTPDSRTEVKIEPIGDAFDRLFLRILHLPTTRRRVETCLGYPHTEPPAIPTTHQEAMEEGHPLIVIHFEVMAYCIQTMESATALKGAAQ